MTIIGGYISSSGVLLGADSGYRKLSEDVEVNESDLTDKIQQASENVVIAGSGYHRYMLFVQEELVDAIDEETKLDKINQLLVYFAQKACNMAQKEHNIKRVPSSKLGFKIWIAGIRPESNGGFLSTLNVDLTETNAQLEPTVREEPRTHGLDVGGTNNVIDGLSEEIHNKLVEQVGYFPFGKWFTEIIDYYNKKEDSIDFPAQMCYITPSKYHEEHYYGVDQRDSPFNTLEFEE